MRKYLLWTIIFVILCTAVSAVKYNIETSPIRPNIQQDQTAQFLVIITNNLNESLEFKMYSPDVEWTVPPKTIEVSSNGETSDKILITPTKYVGAGIYGVKVNFKEEELGELTQKTLYVNILTGEDVVSAYLPSVNMVVNMPEAIDPREDVSIKVSLDNLNYINYDDLVIRITSKLLTFNTEQVVELGSGAKKVVELIYKFDPVITEPGEYAISFDLLKENESIIRGGFLEVVNITTVKPAFKEAVVTESVLLRTISKITYISDSNTADLQTVKIPTKWFTRIFTSTVPASRGLKEEGKAYLAIDLALEPGESKIVEVTTNYRYPIIMIIVIILFAIFYFNYRSPIRVRKGISDVQMTEGGISELKVMLELTSISKKTLKNVTVVDYIPNIADLQKEFVEGTLKPTAVLRHHKKGTIIKWVLPEIAPGEDRLISYDIKSKLSILGNFKLPRAKVIYKRKRKQRHAYSNGVGVNS